MGGLSQDFGMIYNVNFLRKSLNYLTYTKNVNHTLALFRFRISSNNLCIETGRYTRPRLPENQRNCIYCKSYNVENELHFLLECDMYKCERGSLFIIINDARSGR